MAGHAPAAGAPIALGLVGTIHRGTPPWLYSASLTSSQQTAIWVHQLAQAVSGSSSPVPASDEATRQRPPPRGSVRRRSVYSWQTLRDASIAAPRRHRSRGRDRRPGAHTRSPRRRTRSVTASPHRWRPRRRVPRSNRCPSTPRSTGSDQLATEPGFRPRCAAETEWASRSSIARSSGTHPARVPPAADRPRPHRGVRVFL